MPVTINNFNYNDPIDNNNIIMMEPPFARGTGRYYKAFKITDRIWIIPERYTLDINLRILIKVPVFLIEMFVNIMIQIT